MCTIHTNYLAPFDEPYVELQEIALEATEEAP